MHKLSVAKTIQHSTLRKCPPESNVRMHHLSQTSRQPKQHWGCSLVQAPILLWYVYATILHTIHGFNLQRKGDVYVHKYIHRYNIYLIYIYIFVDLLFIYKLYIIKCYLGNQRVCTGQNVTSPNSLLALILPHDDQEISSHNTPTILVAKRSDMGTGQNPGT